MNASSVRHDEMANAIRALAMDAVEAAKSGHPGMPMGMADVATVLFTRHLRYCAGEAGWPDRDRFVLSAGHGSMLLFALLHLTGYPDMTLDELKSFRQLGSRAEGHPEYGHSQGIETTTGPLGQGISTAVGMAIAERHLNARFGNDLVDHRTFVICSDGDLMEGISHEACSMAGHLGLGRLVVLFDDNEISIDGPTSLSVSDDQLKRFESYGWRATRVDGHDAEAIDAAIRATEGSDRPWLIACRTVIGKGAPTKAGKSSSHGSPLGAKEIEGARAALNWPHEPFVLPEPVLNAWRAAGSRGAEAVKAWHARFEAASTEVQKEFIATFREELPADLGERVAAMRAKLCADKPRWATRKSSQMALEMLTEAVPLMVGGSADLTGSNNTNTPSTLPMRRSDYAGRYVHFGVREHGMMAAMNGMAVHGGVIPYGGTFLVFADYCRPSIRLAALMKKRVILVATHDSIGLGEDGATHQPVEHLASLRAMPNVLVFRPADAVETLECWEQALLHTESPSVLALSRQELPLIRAHLAEESWSARGAYVLAGGDERQATILATGSEVHIALAARDRLAEDGVQVAVVSMPCWELFRQQDPAYQAGVLGTAPRVAVEAASPFGWTRYVASEDDVVGMTGFGASGRIEALYEHFGITPEKVAAKVRAHLA